MAQGQDDQFIKTLNSNSIYKHYGFDVNESSTGNINIFVNPKRIYENESEYGEFITTRPVAIIHQANGTSNELSIEKVSFNVKPHWKIIMDSNAASYFVIRLNDQIKHFVSEDGIEHEYHEAKLMQITKEELVKKLHDRELKNFKVEEFEKNIL